mmetsp:Transcript_25829/g.28998  ORF Transcript_25829/g.28998 Transcript_25829/m.28998 type:complete len:80 (-) Transcript_25829:91-330(-)
MLYVSGCDIDSVLVGTNENTTPSLVVNRQITIGKSIHSSDILTKLLFMFNILGSRKEDGINYNVLLRYSIFFHLLARIP